MVINDSKDYMSEALLQLMKDKDLNQITSMDIAKRAGVSRATWFRHFKSKREAVVYGLVRLWDRWAEEHALENSHKIVAENAESFVEYIYSIRHLREHLLRNDLHSVILDSFIQVLLDNNQFSDNHQFIRSTFVTYGITGIVDAWSDSAYTIPQKEIAQSLKILIRDNLD